jgi:hypothetical protein
MIARTYISYATKDVKVAQTLCSALESRGIGCWINARDIQPGENFQVSIVRALREAKIMVLVFTHNSNSSDEMTRELALASQQKLIVIPLRVDDVTPGEAFAYEFATRQWIDVFADWESSIDQLCRRISLALEGVAADAPVVLKEDQTVAARLGVVETSRPDEAPLASSDDANIEVSEGGAGRPPVARLALLAAGLAIAVGVAIAVPMLLQGKSPPGAPLVASRAGGPPAAENVAPSVAPATEPATLPLAAVALTVAPVQSPRVKPRAPKSEAPKREAETDIPY